MTSVLRRVGYWAIGLSIVAVAGYFIVRHFRPQRKALRFNTARVDRGPIVAKVTASGTLSALVTVQVGSQVSGRIKKIFVDYNSPVTKGQVVAKIDPQLFHAAVEQARANYLLAKGELAKAKVQAVDDNRKYLRAKVLAEKQIIARAELDTAQATAEAAKAQVKANAAKVELARAALHQAKINLAYTTIVSPINGVVISRNVDIGQTVAASFQTPTLFTIAEDLRKMQVDTTVAEADIGKLTPGMTATFTVDAYPLETFTGKVRQIRNAAQVVQNVVTYDAVIDVDNPGLKLKPGMTANVTFVFAKKDNVLRVPNAALRFRPTHALLAGAGVGGLGKRRPGPRGPGPPGPGVPRHPARAGGDGLRRRVVWVLRGGKPRPVEVTLGISNGRMTELVRGDIKVGDAVITDAVGGPSPRAGRPPPPPPGL